MKYISAFVWFIHEREQIRVKRLHGMRPPWTENEILRKYRFCNINREFDRVTQWWAHNWRNPNQSDPHLWFASLVFREVNLPETAAQLGYPVPWRPATFRNVVTKRQLKGEPVYNGAYMISTHSHEGPKHEYLIETILNPLWKVRDAVAPRANDTLSTFASRLLEASNGLGTFMVGQVVADIKYCHPLISADDWHTWAYSGPGSRRGLNRVLGRDTNAPWREHEWYAELMELQALANELLSYCNPPVPALHAQDLQNCLCEFDKYERARLGEGRPKSRYQGE